METAPIYLDHNATTPVLPEVVDAMIPYLRDHFGNPSSTHPWGRAARAGVDGAREQVAALLGCAPAEVLFTSGGTEANNLAIRGTVAARGERRGVITSVIEHPATAEPCAFLQRHGWVVHRAGVDGDGVVRLAEIEGALDGSTALVTVMHANNEVGTLQPIRDIAQRAHAAGAVVHSDAAQSVGKVPVRVEELQVDLLSVAAHKLYGPKGIGALYVRAGTPLRPMLRGAGHERGLRPGTENVASIVGLGCACAIAVRDQAQEARRLCGLRDELLERLRAAIPGVVLQGHPRLRLPNTLSVRFQGVSGTALLAAAPTIAATTGSACHEDHESPSAVLTAMGIDEPAALGTVRLSLGRSTTAEQVALAAGALIRAYQTVSRDRA